MGLAPEEAKTTLHAKSYIQINLSRLEAVKIIQALRGNDQREISDMF